MNRSLTILFALTLSHSFFSPLTAQQIAPGAIIVRVYDFAGIPANETARAQQEADDIFARSNVRLTWLNCTMDSERRPADPTCNAVSGPSVLNLRLMPREMEPKNGLAKGVFGFSLMSTTGGYSSTTNVYVDRVATIADGRKCRQPVVLGAIIAHELGHLLLGIGSHSKSGLMSLPYGPKALTAADQGTLSFSKKESSKLAKTASERIGVVIEAAFWGDPERVERLQLTLRLYNYAGVQPGVLERTKRESDRIFNGLGIEAGWLACPTSPEQISTNRVCAGPSGPTQLVLNLLPHSMSKKYGFQKGIFGFALPTGEGQPGTKISLFFKRVLDLAYWRSGPGSRTPRRSSWGT